MRCGSKRRVRERGAPCASAETPGQANRDHEAGNRDEGDTDTDRAEPNSRRSYVSLATVPVLGTAQSMSSSPRSSSGRSNQSILPAGMFALPLEAV